MTHKNELRLRNVRCVSLSAKQGPNTARTGGILSTTIASGFRPGAAASTAEGFVEIAVRGLPAEAADEDDFAFELQAKVTGQFFWAESTETPPLDDKEFSLPYLQSLYVAGVMSIKELALRMGFSNINIFWDMRRNDELLAKAGQVAPKVESATPSSDEKKVKTAAKVRRNKSTKSK